MRLAAIRLQSSLLDDNADKGPVRDVIRFAEEVLSSQAVHSEGYLASQLVCAFDSDRQVRRAAVHNWQRLVVSFDITASLSAILEPVCRTVLALTSGDAQSEVVDPLHPDERAEEAAACLGAYGYLLQFFEPALQVVYESILESGTVYRLLSQAKCSHARLRAAAWQCVDSLLSTKACVHLVDEVLPELSSYIKTAAFREQDPNAQTAMLEAMRTLCRSHNEFWMEHTGDDDRADTDRSFQSGDDNDTSFTASPSGKDTRAYTLFTNYCHLLETALHGHAHPGYTLMADVLDTIPLAFWTGNETDLLDAYWKGCKDGKLLLAPSLDVAHYLEYGVRAVKYFTRQTWTQSRCGMLIQVAVDMWCLLFAHKSRAGRKSTYATADTPACVQKILIMLENWQTDSSASFWTSIERPTITAISQDVVEADLIVNALVQISTESGEYSAALASSGLRFTLHLLQELIKPDDLDRIGTAATVLAGLLKSPVGPQILNISEMEEVRFIPWCFNEKYGEI